MILDQVSFGSYCAYVDESGAKKMVLCYEHVRMKLEAMDVWYFCLGTFEEPNTQHKIIFIKYLL